MYEKLNFVKITFINCELEYTYTICKFDDIRYQIEAVESDFKDINGFWVENVGKPRISITSIQLTQKQFDGYQLHFEQNA